MVVDCGCEDGGYDESFEHVQSADFVEIESDYCVDSVGYDEGYGCGFVGVVVALIEISDVVLVLERRDCPVENVHGEVLNTRKESLFHNFGVKNLPPLAHLIEHYHNEGDQQPSDQEDSE